MSKYKLTYYNLQGLAEPIRYIFKVAGVEFEDNRIPKDDTTYPKLPPNIKDALPWGSIPILEVDGRTIAQTSAICRFLANRFNLVGADEFEKATCDELHDAMREFGDEFRNLMRATDDAAKAEQMEKMKTITVPFYMGRLNKIALKNGKWLVGKNVTWVDIIVAHFITLIMTRSKIPITDGFPGLKKLCEDVYNIPAIKAWMAARPDTE